MHFGPDKLKKITSKIVNDVLLHVSEKKNYSVSTPD